jgi:DNA-binding HxlR family transcriptional regulator
MKGYGQFCPVAKAAEIFAERWTPILLRDLLRGPRRFSELHQGAPRMSQSVLVQRLRSLERQGIVARRPSAAGKGWQYHLTPAGEEFGEAVERLGEWGMRHSIDKLRLEDLDPGFLMWAIEGHIHVDALPEHRVVIQVDFRGRSHEHWWLVLDRPNVELCLEDHGFEPDLFVMADLRAMTEVYLGRRRLTQAMETGLVEVHGPRLLVRAFPRWIGVSSFARYGQSRALVTSSPIAPNR